MLGFLSNLIDWLATNIGAPLLEQSIENIAANVSSSIKKTLRDSVSWLVNSLVGWIPNIFGIRDALKSALESVGFGLTDAIANSVKVLGDQFVKYAGLKGAEQRALKDVTDSFNTAATSLAKWTADGINTAIDEVNTGISAFQDDFKWLLDNLTGAAAKQTDAIATATKQQLAAQNKNAAAEMTASIQAAKVLQNYAADKASTETKRVVDALARALNVSTAKLTPLLNDQVVGQMAGGVIQDSLYSNYFDTDKEKLKQAIKMQIDANLDVYEEVYKEMVSRMQEIAADLGVE